MSASTVLDKPQAAIRHVIRLMVGAAVTDLGTGLFMLLGPWLLYDLTHSAFWVGTAAVVQGLMVWAGPALGWVVDRMDRRRALALALVAQALGSGGLAVLVDAHRATVLLTLLAVALIYAGTRLQLLAGSTVRFLLTPVDARLSLNSLWAFVTLLAQYGSPGLAGFLLQWRGEAFGLWVQTFAVLPMLAVALFLPRLAAPPREESGSLREAAATLISERGLWFFTWMMGLWNWSFGGILAILVYFYRHDLHFSAGQVGLAGLFMGLIPMGFALIGARLNRKFGPGRILVGGVVLSGLGMLVLPGMGAWYSVGTVLGMLDGPIGPILAAMSTIMQARIPSHLFGRVNAIRNVVSMGTAPTAGILSGFLAGRIGAPAVIEGLGGVTVLGAVILAWRTPVMHVTLSGTVAESGAAPARAAAAVREGE
ncbi:MAG: MFS transporter [Clostridia bacterium]